MQSELRIEDLLKRWKQSFEDGENIPIDELCADCPEIRDELEQRISDMQGGTHITDGKLTGTSVDQIKPATVDCKESGAAPPAVDGSDSESSAVHGQDAAAPINAEPDDPTSLNDFGSLQTINSDDAIEPFGQSQTSIVSPTDDCQKVSSQSNYKILRLHAKGGLGEVYLASDSELHRNVALKFIKEDHVTRQSSLDQFQLECEVTARLEHPGIVPVYGIGRNDDGQPFHAMQFLHGETLGDVIDRYHEMEEKEVGERSVLFENLISRFISVCNTIAYAHNRGILHRDIKPDNIMLGKYGETIVVDWGLALPVARNEAARASGEQTLMPGSGSSADEFSNSSVVGTPSYMSPEQAAGIPNVTAATDVYSLGALLYKLITGETPFHGSHIKEILRKVKKGQFQPPSEVVPDVSRPLEAICLKAMARNPSERYATALELKSDIERWRADEPVMAHRDRWRESLRRWSRRNRKLTQSAAAVLLMALVAVTSWGTSTWNHRDILIAQRLEDLVTRANIEEGMLQRDFATLEQDVRFLATHPLLYMVGGNDPEPTESELGVSKSFHDFLVEKSSYMQVRFLDDTGMEVVRVDRAEPGSEVRIRKKSEMQSKSGKPYFTVPMKLNAGKVFLSKVELNQEHGKKQWDVPVIRASVPVFEQGTPIGAVVINMHFSRLAELVEKSATKRLLVYLTNSDGEFLLHPNPRLDFCFERELEYRIEDVYPRLATFRIKDSNANRELKLTKVTPVASVLVERRSALPQDAGILNDAVTSLIETFPKLRPTFSEDHDMAIVTGIEAFEIDMIQQQLKNEFGEKVSSEKLPSRYLNTSQAVYCRKIHFDQRQPKRYLGLVLVLPY